MTQQGGPPGAIAGSRLGAGDRFARAGMHAEPVQQAFKKVEDGAPVHPRTLASPLGTARLDEPIGQAPELIGHSGEGAPFLLVLLEEAGHHRLGGHVEATATLVQELQRRLRAATA